MSEFENLIDKLLEQKTELTKVIIEKQIAELKKEKIGAGYLTDQGALFLDCIRLWRLHYQNLLKVEIEFKRSICRSKRNFIRDKSFESFTCKTVF